MWINFCLLTGLIILNSLYVFTQGQALFVNNNGGTQSQREASETAETIRDLQTQITENSNTIRQQKEILQALRDDLKEQEDLLIKLMRENGTDTMQGGSTNVLTSPSTTVAGAIDIEKVSMYASLTTIFDDQGIIPFDKVYTNIGGRYQKTTGYFVCPVDGFYIFSWSVETKSADILTSLKVNGHDVATLTAHPDSRFDSDSNTQTVVVNMIAGDKAGIYLKTGTAQPRCSFSGWKIKDNNKGAVLHAVLSGDANSGTLRFDEVLFNEDNLYSKSTGRYTAKERGTYFFCLSIKGEKNVKNVGQLIFKLGRRTYTILVDADGPNTYEIGTICMAVIMKVGDYAFAGHYPNKVLGMHTTFTGLKVDNENDTVPSFAATTTRSFTDRMKFETEVSDSGMYNKNTGKAVIPSDGVYVFTWNTKSLNDDNVVSQIMVNGVPKGERLADSPPRRLEVSTGFVILELSRNDEVYITVKSGTAYGWASNFSGFRLRKL